MYLILRFQFPLFSLQGESVGVAHKVKELLDLTVTNTEAGIFRLFVLHVPSKMKL